MFGTFAACTALAMAGLAQVPEETTSPRTQAALSSSREEAGRDRKPRWPKWLKVGAELRSRMESGAAFDPAGGGHWYLNRLRLDATVQPAGWFQVYLQAQDARAVSLGGHDPAELRDAFDLHLAYLDLGRREAGWRVRVGRQPLAFGDERLLGADSDWDPLGQAFDSVLLGYTGAHFRATAFTGYRVVPAVRGLDPFDTDSRVSGVWAAFPTRGQGVLEPYLFWKRGGNTTDLMRNPGHRDVLTPGIRAQGVLAHGADYNVEMALQRGHVVGDSVSAWAGHWELGWKPLGGDFGLRLGLEYNFASGDRDAGDGRHGTFDDLYPAGFNPYGMADPIAWRNVRYPALAVGLPVARGWTLYGCYRHYWLASTHDGLYAGGDEYLVKNPAAGADVGGQALVSVRYAVSAHWHLFGGYGYLFPGGFLRQSGYPAPQLSVYLVSGLTF